MIFFHWLRYGRSGIEIERDLTTYNGPLELHFEDGDLVVHQSVDIQATGGDLVLASEVGWIYSTSPGSLMSHTHNISIFRGLTVYRNNDTHSDYVINAFDSFKCDANITFEGNNPAFFFFCLIFFQYFFVMVQLIYCKIPLSIFLRRTTSYGH